jgi:glycosyltransferase 2 family protein
MKIPKPLINILKIIFTILLLFLVFQSIDVSKISNDLRSFSFWRLFALLIVCWIGQLICSERWRIFASSLKMEGGYRNFVQMYFVGMFFNIGLPSLVGGDAIKAYILSRKSNKPLHIGLASVLQDRAAGLISLLIYGFTAILLYPVSWKGFPLWVAYVFCWAGVALTLWVILKGEGLYRRLLIPNSDTFLQRMLRMIAEFHQALGMSNLQPGAFFRIALYSFINSGLVLWLFQQVTVAAGHKVDIIPFSALFPIVTIATMLPITLLGLGVREWCYVEALSLVGIPRNTGLCISLATSALLLLCNLAGVFFLPSVPAELRHQAAERRISQRNDVS